jgi:hypothetical protein
VRGENRSREVPEWAPDEPEAATDEIRAGPTDTHAGNADAAGMRSIIPTSLVVAAALLAPVTASADVLPPSATGPADVGFKRTTFTDHQRTERHVPGGGPRHVPLRVWYPAAAPGPGPAALFTPAEQAAWESSNGLPAASLNGLGGAATSGAAPAPGRHPILLLSPGFGETTAFLSAHGADLASHGYVVVAMDHPGETSAVELPDGRLATLDPRIDQTNPRHAGRLATIRVKDMRFVIDRLRALRGAGRLDLSRIGVFGHSDGGNAAANAMLAERRLDAGIDLDGQISGPVTRTGLDRPFGVMLGMALSPAMAGSAPSASGCAVRTPSSATRPPDITGSRTTSGCRPSSVPIPRRAGSEAWLPVRRSRSRTRGCGGSSIATSPADGEEPDVEPVDDVDGELEDEDLEEQQAA